ncbi:hypothetical protein C8F04DRAFT_1063126 [Mycena alexandri]|uniref:Uncharacterized protein n=1 Tax=Mycena alexandri TaxID=1745969 RepID=A0AAD6XB84_9AGAR|nr:hypothetical protein C8F04DRAFT_1063126 [Mycena alexandri]
MGLAASLVLLLLSFIFAPKVNNTNITIDGTGLLHAMWLYCNHPELETLLEQVEHPTLDNLRQAGMVKCRLVDGGQSRDGDSQSSFDGQEVED